MHMCEWNVCVADTWYNKGKRARERANQNPTAGTHPRREAALDARPPGALTTAAPLLSQLQLLPLVVVQLFPALEKVGGVLGMVA